MERLNQTRIISRSETKEDEISNKERNEKVRRTVLEVYETKNRRNRVIKRSGGEGDKG